MSNEVRTSSIIEEIAEITQTEKKKVAEIYDVMVDLVKKYSSQEKTIILKGLVKIFPYKTKAKPFYNCKRKQMEMTKERLTYKARMSDSFNRKMQNERETEEISDTAAEEMA